MDVRKVSKIASLAILCVGFIYADGAKEIKLKTPSLKMRSIDGAMHYKVKNGNYADVYRVNTQVDKIKKFNHGRQATDEEIQFNDIDVRYDWQGLPDGKGSVAQGEELYNKHCVMCHGDFGAGGKGYPTLAGGEKSSLKNQLLDPDNGDEPPVKTIGSYWPYASTLWWYVKTGMPFPHPMSLSNDEVYAIVAYLLSLNEIQIDGQDLDDDYVLTKEKLMKVKMPNEDGFYPNVNKYGPEIMKKYLSNSNNYGTPNIRCMKNCPTGEVVHIKHTLDEAINPPVTTKRDLPKETKKEDGASSKYAKLYEAKCSACHNNKAIAPVIGDKEAWAPRIKQGIETLYTHAIKGFQGMPPKGGNANLSDADVKGIVDYIISKSK